MLQGPTTALKKRAGADLFAEFEKNPPEITRGFKLNRPGVNVAGTLMRMRKWPNKDGKSFSLRVEVWLHSFFQREDVPADAGIFKSNTEIGVFVQHRKPLTTEIKEEYKKKNVKLSSNAKWTLPDTDTSTYMSLHWNTILDFGLYNGNGLQPGLKVGDSVILRGLYYEHQHTENGNDIRSFNVPRVEKAMSTGMANIHFSSLLGHTRNIMVKLQTDLDRSELIDPSVAHLPEEAQNANWVKELNAIYRLNEESRIAAGSMYIFPLQRCTPDSELGDKLGNYFDIKSWVINTKEVPQSEPKRNIISTGIMNALQIVEKEDKPIVGQFSVTIFSENLLDATCISNPDSIDILRGLLRVAKGAIFAQPDVLSESEVSHEDVDFQTNCTAARFQIDLPRAIMEQGLEIPGSIVGSMLSHVKTAQENYMDKTVKASGASKVINLCETQNSAPLNYVFFFVSAETMDERAKKGPGYTPSRFRKFIEGLTETERASFWPFWSGNTDSCQVSNEMEKEAEFHSFKPDGKFIIFAIQLAEVERVRLTPSFPDVGEAIKIYEEIKKVELQKTQEFDAAMVAAADAAEAAYYKKKAEEEAQAAQQSPKRQKVGSEEEESVASE